MINQYSPSTDKHNEGTITGNGGNTSYVICMEVWSQLGGASGDDTMDT